MSKIALEPNVAGTGTFSIASPNSNTSRTLTLPDVDGTVVTADASGNVSFYEDTGTTAKFFWDASAESLTVGGTSAPSEGTFSVYNGGDEVTIGHLSGTSFIDFFDATAKGADIVYRTAAAAARPNTLEIRTTSGDIAFRPANTEAMRINASGALLVGKTAQSVDTVGGEILSTGIGQFTVDGNFAARFTRQTSDGDIVVFRKNGATVGSIGVTNNDMFFGNGPTSLKTYNAGNAIHGFDASSLTNRDNAIDLGMPAIRFDDIYATNGTIQTSDRNEKQQIAELTAAEMQAAKAISGLFKTFKWNDSVAENGDAARIHSGVIAQEIEAAMADAGLDAGKYAFFISSTWWEAEGQTYETAEEAPEGAVERTRKGIRYSELLAFVGAATEQRLASIEARLTALETIA